jgi:glutathione synthase/RimK-type ligase-like ATP-grasp enzyme
MIKSVCVVENVRAWKKRVPQMDFISANEYLFAQEYQEPRSVRVINLARNYGYLGQGYYVSLVAEARGHKVIPSISTLQALSRKEFWLIETDDLAAQIQKDLAHLGNDRFELSVYFGRNVDKKYEKLARMFFNLFPCPSFRVYFIREAGMWKIASLKAVGAAAVPEHHKFGFADSMVEFSVHRWGFRPKVSTSRYDLAILYNPQEGFSPSNEMAIAKFIKASKAVGLDAEVIEKRDFGLLQQFDALFIRETTSIDHHTYRFAKKAAKENMVVIDDPKSILYCTNKIFLYELFKRAGIPRPETLVVGEDRVGDISQKLGFPVILKIPDGSFSRGIVKAKSPEELEMHTQEFLKRSDYIVAQSFMPTEFDWRVGVFNGRPLFACQYFMTRNHWQIYNHGADGRASSGAHKTFAVENVDPRVIQLALKAAKLIGDGLYGVDIKMFQGKPYVVEVNDNPNIDAGVEDSILKDQLYLTIMQEFLNRIERGKMRKETPAAGLVPNGVASGRSSKPVENLITASANSLTPLAASPLPGQIHPL